jgi:uncharacterized membrane protein
VAFVFRDQFRAPEVLNELRRRDFAWSRDLDEAVAVTLDANGKARVQLSVDISQYAGAGWARLWGSFLSSTLFMPGAEVIVEAADGVAFSNNKALARLPPANGPSPENGWWEEALAGSANFKRDVAALLEPSGSAIFTLLRAAHAPIALKQLRNYGDTIVHASISSEQDKRMFALLAAGQGRRT